MAVESSYARESGTGSYEAGAIVSIRTGSHSGYRFSGWTSSDGITFAGAERADTTFVMPDKTVNVIANWASNSSGAPSSGGPSASDEAVTYPLVMKQPDQGGSVTVTPNAPQKGDTVTVELTPDERYQVKDVAVTDQSGNAMKLTQKSDNEYTFTQPSSRVIIEADFDPLKTYIGPSALFGLNFDVSKAPKNLEKEEAAALTLEFADTQSAQLLGVVPGDKTTVK